MLNEATINFYNQEIQEMQKKVQETELNCKLKIQRLEQAHKNEIEKLKASYEAIIKQKDEIIAELESKLNTNSKNSSNPPSTDRDKEKSTNQYNSRKSTDRKKGGQKGHKGKALTKKQIRELIDSGEATEKVVDIGNPKAPVIREHYVVDIEVKRVVTRIQVHEGADSTGIPKAPCSYGNNLKSLEILLFSDGKMSVDRIASVLRELTENLYPISSGFVYNTLVEFAKKSKDFLTEIANALIKSPTLYTDDTTMPVNGVKNFVRNISNGFYVLYWPHEKKNIEALLQTPVLNVFTGNLVHDHETALYNLLRCSHYECLIHLIRRLRKNSEDTGNSWQAKMIELLVEVNKKLDGDESVLNEEGLNDFLARYDAIIELGYEENKSTKVKKFKQKEKSLLNDLKKYKDNYTGFASTPGVGFTNNLSERDLRKIVCRRKSVYGTREFSGLKVTCSILSVTETLKKQNKSLLKGLSNIFD